MHAYVDTKDIFKIYFQYTCKAKKSRWKLHIATLFLQACFRVFTTPDNSGCSRKDRMNQTFPSLRAVAGEMQPSIYCSVGYCN